MKAICFSVVVGFLTIFCFGETMANQDIKPLGPDEVHIGPNGIAMPMGRILLIKRANVYWAVKFIMSTRGT